MQRESFQTLDELARNFNVTSGTLREWIRKGKIDVERQGKLIRLSVDEKNHTFLQKNAARLWRRPPKAWVPLEIAGFNTWHELLDEFCWLVKVHYSTPRQIRVRKFRLDELLASFLNRERIDLKRIRSVFGGRCDAPRKSVSNDLQRAWYNELAFCSPLRAVTLDLSFSAVETNKVTSASRLTFPSWRVVQMYYSVYFFVRAMTLQKCSNFRLEEHAATLRAFTNNLRGPMQRVAWKFPFDIAYDPARAYSSKRSPNYEYLRHPRPPHRTPNEIVTRLCRTYKRHATKVQSAGAYGLLELLRDLRIWANYKDIDNLLRLAGHGYKAILDQNMSTILFFIGAISELSYSSVHGIDEYGRCFQDFYDLIVTNNEELLKNFIASPMYQRREIYSNLGLISCKFRFADFESPHTVQLSRRN